MKKLIIGLMICMFMLSFVSAESQKSLGTFKKGDCVPIIQTCGTCTYVNISSILINNDQDTKLIIFNEEMEKNEQIYNYSFCNTTTLGEYNINGVGDLDGTITAWAYNIEITPTGKQLSTGEAMLYFILTIAVFLFFLFSLYAVIVIPYGNEKNVKGEITAITKTKYLKIGLILITQVLFTWFLNLLIGISGSFLSLKMSYGLIEILFYISNYIAYPLFVVIFVWVLFELIRDSGIRKELYKWGSA